MQHKEHQYEVNVRWTGNKGSGTSTYTSYTRDHNIRAGDKAQILASSDPAFRGDRSRYNPEELLVASLSSCHMLWFLHLCAQAGVVVEEYEDHAQGIMRENSGGSGRFEEVILNPVVTVSRTEMIEKAQALHLEANTMCFVANSCNFPVTHRPKCLLKTGI